MKDYRGRSDDHQDLEILGVGVTIAAYICIVTGYLGTGFAMGLFANVFHAIWASLTRNKGIFFLQFFFFCANMYGLINLGITK